MIVVTGGSGFIGSNFIIDWLTRFDEELVNIDIMTYAANNDNLKDIIKKDIYSFVQEDICNYDEIFTRCVDIGNKIKTKLELPICENPLMPDQNKFFKTVYRNPDRISHAIIDPE